ncbi:MAG TPA: hypothetical protein VJY15_13940, partial [Candidatus Acidoferrum sp.]|nr:hypothetical protein [Candidatus Acidoferrum sp.]
LWNVFWMYRGLLGSNSGTGRGFRMVGYLVAFIITAWRRASRVGAGEGARPTHNARPNNHPR